MLIVLLIGRIFEKVMKLWKEMKLWGRLYVLLISIKKQIVVGLQYIHCAFEDLMAGLFISYPANF
jgi:hypothetical protein